MLNLAVLMGRLTADPELKHTPNNVAVTSFAIAVDRQYCRSGEERQADFIDIVAWRGTAEFVCKYFRKGQMIALQGGIQTRSYTDSQGIKRKAFEIVADQVSFCGSKQENPEAGSEYARPAQIGEMARDAGLTCLSALADDDPREMSDDDLPF